MNKQSNFKVESALIFIATILSMIGIIVPAWSLRLGLFLICSGPGLWENCKLIDHSREEVEYFILVFAFSGVILLIISTLDILYSKRLQLYIPSSLLGGVCLLIACILYFYTFWKNNVYWACYLTTAAGVISILGGLLLKRCKGKTLFKPVLFHDDQPLRIL